MSPQKVIARWQFFRGISETPSWQDCAVDLFVEYERLENDSVKHVISLKISVGNVYTVLRYHFRRDLQDRPIIPFNGNVYVAKCDKSQFKHKSKVSYVAA